MGLKPHLPNLGRLGFGGASLGGLGASASWRDAEEAVHEALQSGIQYFDTAPFYGFGLSERRLGDLLRGQPGVVVSTKVGRLLEPDANAVVDELRNGFVSPMPFSAIFNYTYDGVMRSYEDSLQRLGLAKIDILYVHDLGQRTHGSQHATQWRSLFEEGGYRALEALRSAGEIAAIGLGVNEWQVAVEAIAIADFDLVMLAGRYTLLDHSAAEPLLSACSAADVKVVAAAVFNSGILASGSAGAPVFDYMPAPAEVVARVRRLEARCEQFGTPLAAAALAFPLRNPIVTCVVPGLGTARRVRQTLSLLETPIPDAFWQSLEADGLMASPGASSQWVENRQ